MERDVMCVRSRLTAPLLAAGLAAVAAVALAGCGGGTAGDGNDPAAPARLGAPAPPSSAPPSGPMNRLERPVAEELAPRLADDGLTLTHVDCPDWTGAVPFETTCQGYVDGVVGEVDVELSRRAGGEVEFDAWLNEGIVATRRLVDRLAAEGYADVDCGPTPAYPARLGMRLVCRVQNGAETGYVVATVTGPRGEVEIEGY
jgi:hypothetical protein